MAVLIPLVLIAVGIALLVGGADVLVRGAARLGRALGMSTFVIGVTIVAFGTSAPELFAGVRAATAGVGDLAVGAVLGSNVANIGLVLGLTALVRAVPVPQPVRRFDVPVMWMVTLLASIALLGDGVVTRVEGVLLAATLVVYVYFTYWAGKRDPESTAHELEHEVEQTLHLETPDRGRAVLIDILLVLAGTVLLAGGAELLVRGATTLATDVLGVPVGVVGLSVVAFGTSLPELAAGLRAALSRDPDMAVGNIVGSNVFNLLSVMGISAIVAPLDTRPGVGGDVLAMIVFAGLCYPVLSKRGLIGRPQGALLLLAYLAYVIVVYAGAGAISVPAG
ncbi:MAG: calcium/sodium antiporter [Planctomycetota bacterium]